MAQREADLEALMSSRADWRCGLPGPNRRPGFRELTPRRARVATARHRRRLGGHGVRREQEGVVSVRMAAITGRMADEMWRGLAA
jgi:hypothetical protein